MKSFLLMALLHLTPAETEVHPGESLAQVARRALGDSSAASELRALNGLKDDTVTPGMKLKLPGPEREHAQKALDSARNSAQADANAPRHAEAQAKLKEAEADFQGARYDEAAQAADAAWKLLSERPAQPTKLSVRVDEQGGTTVRSYSGKVSVEGGGTTRTLENGGTLRVEKGQAPRAPLGVPQPTRPADNQKLSQKPGKGGLEPVVISWQGVEGAEGYEVELIPAAGGDKRVIASSEPQLKVALAAGSYHWSVRALSRQERSDASTTQGFEVAEAPARPLKVKVNSTTWK